MARRKRGGFFFKWIKSDLPDREEISSPVLLLAVHKTQSPLQEDIVNSDYLTLPVEPQTERHRRLLTQLNERFRKTLSLDSRVNDNRKVSGSNARPKSMVNAPNFNLNNCSSNSTDKSSKTVKKKRFRPKSFFTLDTFLDSRRSEASSIDDFHSSKYCKFYLDSSAECSPVLKGRATPDLLDLPVIVNCEFISDESRCKKRLDKLENHFNKIQRLKNSRQTVASNKCGNGQEPIYAEPIYDGSTTSQSTLVIGIGNDINIPKEEHVAVKGEQAHKIGSNQSQRNGAAREHSHSSISNSVSFDVNACSIDCSNLTPNRKSRGICCKEGTPSSAYEINVTHDDILNIEKTKNLVVKTMDKSVDSIGSCSLDVDAENTDFSDTTSGSLNILTPSSTASHYRDFASKFHERTAPVVQDLRSCPLEEENTSHIPVYRDIAEQIKQSNHFQFNNTQPKKPSYLHLACSVNGYSNLTTYDSTLRQKLSKSREQSPARIGNISSFILRNCPNSTMANNTTKSINSNTYFKTSLSETSISSQNVITYLKSNGQTISSENHSSKSYQTISNGNAAAECSKSFIQQRVERLYGPGALAQGFFNQKKQMNRKSFNGDNGLREISPHKDINNIQNGIAHNNMYSNYDCVDNESVLPVFRHLRAEFRAQLPLSPKKSPLCKFADNTSRINTECSRLKGADVVDRVCPDENETKLVVTVIPIQKTESSLNNNKSSNGDLLPKTGVSSDIDSEFDDVNKSVEYVRPIVDETIIESYENIPVIKQIVDNAASTQTNVSQINNSEIIHINAPKETGCEDGHHFLALCHVETLKLEQLAEKAELELQGVQDNPEVSEEVRGFLRVAAGKARLLATEKMKQFEGLCFKNLNAQLDNKFPTTIEDLRGFWDMVYLQVDDIGILFEQIDSMRSTGWKMIPTKKRADVQSKPSSNAKKSIKSKCESAPASKSALSKKRDEERKALIEAKRRAAKLQSKASVEIFANQPPSDLPNKSEQAS